MGSSEIRTHLYVEFEGVRGERRPVLARPRAPRSGIKVRIAVETEAMEQMKVYLLFRRGYGDMVLGASASRQYLEGLREKLGNVSQAYEIAEVPILVRQQMGATG